MFDFPFLFDCAEKPTPWSTARSARSCSRAAGQGLVGLAYWDLGFRHLTNSKRAITKIEDMPG